MHGVTLRTTFGRLCRDTRVDLDITQVALAAAVGVSRSYIARIELGRANPSVAMADRIAEALGLQLEAVARRPLVLGRSDPRDFVHARCSAYAQRRLSLAGFAVVREVEIVDRGTRGWIDLLAFDPRTGRLLIVEIKTSIADLGALERQVAWYERLAAGVAAEQGWVVREVVTWVLCLASAEVDGAIGASRELFAAAFPGRATAMRAMLTGEHAAGTPRRCIALVDPGSRRRDWLIGLRIDGRRAPLPYQDRAGAARVLGGRRV